MQNDTSCQKVIYQWGRRCGKTTKCYELLRENPDATMIVLNLQTKKNAPKDLQDRIITWRQLLETPLDEDSDVIVDEPEYMSDLVLAGMERYYNLCLVAGSPAYKKKNKPHWFRELCERNKEQVSHRTILDSGWIDKETVEHYKNVVSVPHFETEFMANFYNCSHTSKNEEIE